MSGTNIIPFHNNNFQCFSTAIDGSLIDKIILKIQNDNHDIEDFIRARKEEIVFLQERYEENISLMEEFTCQT